MKSKGYLERLAEFVEGRLEAPYAWGTNDCVAFAADAVQVVTGADPLGDLRGTWTDELSALLVLDAAGGMIAAVDARFPRRSEPQLAQRGDICLVKVEGVASLAVCLGAHCAAPGDDGLMMVPLAEVRISWET